ncbi:hypothetical protein P5673_030546 [Acropora cervicornis]|uniref:Uncharacterized protein n=1 Tax=Acropora cervicornis TaxID=6130 RepID=A0AAD9PTZ3_ACRCE|nr:hypothetical protein P5673_030546 [Acropora cervicornis]
MVKVFRDWKASRNDEVSVLDSGAASKDYCVLHKVQPLSTALESMDAFSFIELDVIQFDQTFDACKDHLLNEKEAVTQSQLRKLKTKSKASSSLISIDGAVKGISKGNPSAANSELGRVKSLITKLNKALLVGKPLKSLNRTNSLAIQRTRKKNSDQPRDERSSRLERRSTLFADHLVLFTRTIGMLDVLILLPLKTCLLRTKPGIPCSALARTMYKRTSNRVVKVITNAKSNYFEDMIIENKNNARNLWKLLKQSPPIRSRLKAPNAVLFNGEQITDPVKIADAFNEYYTFVCVLNETLLAISSSLVLIYNASISNGAFPVAFKIAKVLPLHNRDSMKETSNYRPISDTEVAIYANDTNIWSNGTNCTDIQNTPNDKANSWFKLNRMIPSIKKTKHLLVGSYKS